MFNIAYVGTRSNHLSTYYNYNIYHFGTGLQNLPQDGAITYNNYGGTANYNGLQTHITSITRAQICSSPGSYSWSHTMDDSPGSSLSSTTPLYYDPQADYGNSAQDQRSVFSSSILYHLPFGQGQRFGGGVNYFTNLAIGGWQLNIIGRMATGNPFDLGAGSGVTNADRPDLIGPISYPKSITGDLVQHGFVRRTPPTVSANATERMDASWNTAAQPDIWTGTARRGSISTEKPQAQRALHA